MANMFKMAKQALEMRSQVKRIQKQLEEQTYEYENAGVKIVVSGDLQVVSVSMTDLAFSERARLERTIKENTNKALRLAKEASTKMMTEMTKEMGGLGSLLGGKE